MRRSGPLSGWLGIVFTVSLVLFTAGPAAAGWHRVDTPNFVVVGEADLRALHDLAVRFEAFREALTRLLSERATATSVPTVVLVFPSDRAFTPVKPRYRGRPVTLDGLFVPGADINYIALVNAGDGSRLRLVFHEYAHLVFSNVARRLPVWLEEGLAEYYSTFELERDGTQATIGRLLGDHLELLRRGPLFPLEALVQVERRSPIYNEGNRRTIFYAQSWALTHLILHGEPRRPHLLHAYLNRFWEGLSPLEAWRRTFGGEQMERELLRYLNRRAFKAHRFTFRERLETFEPSAMPLVRADVEAFLADLLLQQQRASEAADRLALAESAGSTAWVSTVAALVDIAQNDLASAARRLVALDAGVDWLTAYRAGVGLSTLVTAAEREAADEHVDAVRRLFASASAAHREMPHAVASLARIELERQGTPSAALRRALEQASRSAPGRLDYVLLRARVLARQSAFAAARQLLAPLMASGQPREVREAARQLMGDIVTVEADTGRAAASAIVERRRDGCCSSPRQPQRVLRLSRELEVDSATRVRLTTTPHETLCER